MMGTLEVVKGETVKGFRSNFCFETGGIDFGEAGVQAKGDLAKSSIFAWASGYRGATAAGRSRAVEL